MKRILITGKNSYIGTSFEKWMRDNHPSYEIDTISVHGDAWREIDFSPYDVVFHVAGIAHRKETEENRDLYFQVNHKLAVDVAKKSKISGVKQFIFLSTMSVYGKAKGAITEETPLKPKNAYGKSKLMAENDIRILSSDSFVVSILRPPMVYGYGCKGNYQTLSRFAKKTIVFPKVNNKRSMIYIDNLNMFTFTIIKNKQGGVFLPTNKDYVNTTELIQQIARINKNKIYYSKFLGYIVNTLSMKIPIFQKVFGDLYYSEETRKKNLYLYNELNKSNQLIKFKESIVLSERLYK